MSRAFVREPDGTEPFQDAPERQISEHPNYVTAAGLAHIEAEVARLTQASGVAQSEGDRAAMQSAARDLRYWQARLVTVELIACASDRTIVQFGSTVTVKRDNGRVQEFKIVGEDEADPKQGSISYVAPLARALMGKQTGDTSRLAGGEIEIIAVR